jgi:hypothetical protein
MLSSLFESKTTTVLHFSLPKGGACEAVNNFTQFFKKMNPKSKHFDSYIDDFWTHQVRPQRRCARYLQDF